VKNACQERYRSAWGHPKARTNALKLLRRSSACPPTRKIGIRSQAAYIGANLDPDTSSDCHDSELYNLLLEKCTEAKFPALFQSSLWHAHADGHRQFGDHIHVELGLLVAISALLLLTTISSACMQLVVQYTLKKSRKLVRPRAQ